MIKLMQKQNILLMYYREGKSQRAIARETGVDRKTIRKYIQKYEEQRKELLEGSSCVDTGELIQAIVEAPKYTVGLRPERKLTEDIKLRIQEHLKENEEKRLKKLHKQLKKPIDIYESLISENIDISYSTVLRHIRKLEETVKEAFIKGSYSPGEICEFDWGEAKLCIGGKKQTLQMATFTSACGNFRYAQLFTKQTTECFQEAHALFFQHVGGVYQTLVYDNMKVAVKRFVGTEKEPTEGLLKLSIYYGFNFRFCNVRAGNEKGHVERSVEVVRRKAFAFRDTFETLEEANMYLLEVCQRLNKKPQDFCEGKSASEILELERPFLLTLPPMFDAARVQYARVDKYSTVVIDQNHYSVPDNLVGKQVLVRIYSNRVLCFYEDEKVAEHKRLTGCHEWRLELEHYLDTLKKKPGALAGSTALRQADAKIQKIYQTYYTGKEKDFIELLQYMKDGVTPDEVQHSIEELCRIHPDHVTTDKIKILCSRNLQMPQVTLHLSQATKEIAEQAKKHLKHYDDLFKTGVVESKEAIA